MRGTAPAGRSFLSPDSRGGTNKEIPAMFVIGSHLNHNQTLVGLKLGRELNHNQTLVRR